MPSDIFAIIGIVFALVCLLWLVIVARSDANQYEIADLISTKGRMDLSKVGQLLALLTTTWIVIHMEIKLKDGTPEWALGLYMLAWVGAGFGSLYARLKGDNTTVTTTSSSETETTNTTTKEGK